MGTPMYEACQYCGKEFTSIYLHSKHLRECYESRPGVKALKALKKSLAGSRVR